MKKNGFYGWISALVCFLVVFCATGVAALTFNIFTIPVTEYYGISRTAYSLTVSISSVLSAIAYFCYGSSVRKIGVKRSIFWGLFLLSIAYGLFASGWGVWTLYAKAIISGIVGVFVGSSALTQIINNWFNEKRGLIIGIVCAASGIGGSLFSPILGLILENYGWRASCALIALLVLLCVPLVGFLLVVKPEEKGMEPLGGYQTTQSVGEKAGLSLQEILRDWRFWLVALAFLSIHFANTPSYNNVAPHLMDSGLSALYVSGIAMVVLLISNAVSKPIMGMINDKLGVLPVVAITCGLSAVAAVLMSFMNLGGEILSIVAVVVLGFGTPITTVAVPLIISRVFGNREYNSVMGFVLAIGYVGSTLGTPISNYIYDTAGSYKISYLICAVFATVTLLLLAVVLCSKKTREHKY